MSVYKPKPMTPRGRAQAAVSGGHGGSPAGAAYDAIYPRQTEFVDVPATYDASAGVPAALTRKDREVDLNPSPFTARPNTTTGHTSPVPYTTGKE